MKLEFSAPNDAGKYNYTLFFMCDSYMGADQEYEFEIDVGEGDEESGEEGSDEEMDED